MANTPITASAIVITLAHPAYTPEDETGTAVSGAAAGDPQNFAMVEGAGFSLDGESGAKEPSVEATSITSSGEQHVASHYRVSAARTIQYITPATVNRWIQKFFETVKNDATRRAATLVETFATGQTNTTTFIVTQAGLTYEKGGVLMGSVQIQPTTPTVEARA